MKINGKLVITDVAPDTRARVERFVVRAQGTGGVGVARCRTQDAEKRAVGVPNLVLGHRIGKAVVAERLHRQRLHVAVRRLIRRIP